MKRLAVAFSGGVDSSLLLKVATDILGRNVLALTAVSETTPHHEKEDAGQFAAILRARHYFVKTHELELPEFVSNSRKRCYICKQYRFGILMKRAAELGYFDFIDGENIDDRGDYRPGHRAARELGVRSPLLEAGFSKEEIRILSKRLKLNTWNAPSSACLASRIPYNSMITARKLRQVDTAEDFIRNMGFSGQVRVRHEGRTARIELDEIDISRIGDSAIRDRVVSYLRELGFDFVALDLDGYRMGSLNRQRIVSETGTP